LQEVEKLIGGQLPAAAKKAVEPNAKRFSAASASEKSLSLSDW